MTATKYELTFTGSATVRSYNIPRYRRFHKTLESARGAAAKVRAAMEARDLPSAAHTAVIYDSDGNQYVA